MAGDMFSKLHNDVIHYMFQFLGTPELLNIAQTHRVFTKEAQLFLVRYVNLSTQWREPTDGECSNKLRSSGTTPLSLPRRRRRPASLTCRGIQENPADVNPTRRLLDLLNSKSRLSENIRYVRLSVDWKSEEPFYYDSLVSDVLRHASNLRQLEINVQWGQCEKHVARGGNAAHVQQEYVALFWVLLSSAKPPKLVFSRPNTATISLLSGNERVRSIVSPRSGFRYTWRPGNMITGSPESKFNPFDTDIHLSRLEEFWVGYTFMTDYEVITLCQRAPMLSRLSIMLPDKSFSPAKLSAGLASTAGTLKELELRGYSTKMGRPFCDCRLDGRQVDFSSLHLLRKLTITSEMWFNTSTRLHGAQQGFLWKLENRTGVHKLIPRNLEQLTIEFQFPQLIFTVGYGYRDMFLNLPHSLQLKGFDWIIELAQKLEDFPHRKSLRLMECDPLNHRDTDSLNIGVSDDSESEVETTPFAPRKRTSKKPRPAPREWVPKEEILQVFDTKGFDLSIQIQDFK